MHHVKTCKQCQATYKIGLFSNFSEPPTENRSIYRELLKVTEPTETYMQFFGFCLKYSQDS